MKKIVFILGFSLILGGCPRIIAFYDAEVNGYCDEINKTTGKSRNKNCSDHRKYSSTASAVNDPDAWLE